MLFSITRISSDKLNVHLTATSRLLVCQDDHTVLFGGKWFSYKKDNQQLPSYLEKDSNVINFSKEQFVTWKSRINKHDQFLEIGHRAFVAGLVKNKITKGEVGLKIDGVGFRTIKLDWSEHMDGIDHETTGSEQCYHTWVDKLCRIFFNTEGEWIYSLDKLQEKALGILVEFAKEKDSLATARGQDISRMGMSLGFYKGVVTDLVNTVIPTTPESIWDMDDEVGGRYAQEQATKHAMAKVAGLLLPSMSVKAPVGTGKQVYGGKAPLPNMDFNGDQLNRQHIGREVSLPEMMSLDILKMARNGINGAACSDIHAAMFAGQDKSYFLSTIIEEMQKAK